MRLYEIVDHPLRVYLEDESEGEVSRLIAYLDSRYAPPPTDYPTSDELNRLLL